MASNVDHGCVVPAPCCSLCATARHPSPPACRGCWPLAAAFRLPSHGATRPATPAESRARTASWTTSGPPLAWAPSAAASGTLARGSTTRPEASRTGPWAAFRCVSACLPCRLCTLSAWESRQTLGSRGCNTTFPHVCWWLRSLLQTMRFQAPNLGGSFAVWGGLFSAFDCTLVAVRKKVWYYAVANEEQF